MKDVFDGRVYKELKEQGFFSDERDLALLFSGDGFKAAKKETRNKKFSKAPDCWPFIVYNFNEPPDKRVDGASSFILGTTTGISKPVLINTFLQVLIDNDLDPLQKGVPCFDGYKKEHFTLRAHVIIVTGDYPGVSLFGFFIGQNGKCGCRFCRKQGIWIKESKHYYFPHTNQTLADVKNLIRTEDSIQLTIKKIAGAKLKKDLEAIITDSGIKGKSELHRLSTLKFPRSFPLDPMHHLYLNLSPTFLDQIKNSIDAEKANVFLGNIEYPSWIEREFSDLNSSGWKASEWKDFILYLILPLLNSQDIVGPRFEFWTKVVALFSFLSEFEISTDNANLIKFENMAWEIIKFHETEGEVTQHPQIAKVMVHLLCHVLECVRDCGPGFVYWMFPVERLLGILGNFIHTSKNPGKNLTKNLKLFEDYKLIRRIYPAKFNCLDNIDLEENQELLPLQVMEKLQTQEFESLKKIARGESNQGHYLPSLHHNTATSTPKNRRRGNKNDAWALFKVSEEDLGIGEIQSLFRPHLSDQIYALVSWLPPPSFQTAYYRVETDQNFCLKKSFINVKSIINSVLVIIDLPIYYAIPKKRI